MARSQSARVDGYSSATSPSSSRGHRDQRYAQPAQPEFLYETSAPSSGRRGVNSAIVLPTSPPLGMDDDPFAPSPSAEVPSISLPQAQVPSDTNGIHEVPMDVDQDSALRPLPPTAYAPVKTTSPESKRSKTRDRHTIQVEYGESESKPKPESLKERPRANGATAHAERAAAKKQSLDIDPQATQKPLPGTPNGTSRRPETATPKSSIPPEVTAPPVSIEVTAPPATPSVPTTEPILQNGSAGSTGSGSSKGRHRKGLSIDKIGIAKMFNSGPAPEPVNGAVTRSPSASQKSVKETVPSSFREASKRPSSVQVSKISQADTSAR